MRTQINGQDAQWPEIVWQLWYTFADSADPQLFAGDVSVANYFTPRRYVNGYDRGDMKEGFTFTVGRRVSQTVVSGGVPRWARANGAAS